jgi:3-methyladenine DNA glycosylase AlkD
LVFTNQRKFRKIKMKASQIIQRVQALPNRKTATVRAIRKEYTTKLKTADPATILTVADQLLDQPDFTYHFFAWELTHYHRPTLHSLGEPELQFLGRNINRWEATDTYAPYLAGVAWRNGQIGDDVIHNWAESDDFWWRRVALVSTIALNTKARGGKGDVARTLTLCQKLVADHEDMIVKAMSWALRELIPYDPDAVTLFVAKHEPILAARVKREVRNKLDTGLKTPKK